MRKLTAFILILYCLFALYGCEKENPYLAYVSDLTQDVYVCETDAFTVKATYGFREEPFVNDGKAGERVYGYTFTLNIIPDDVRRTVQFTFEKENYSAAFALDGVSNEYKAFVEINCRFEKQFAATISTGAKKSELTFISELPNGCITYECALDILAATQQPLLNVYTTENGFNAELYMRVFVKNGKPYWYVGIAQNNKLKAFLMDGVSGDLLAVRDIF